MIDRAVPPGQHPARALTAKERAVLDFERDWRSHEGGKTKAVRERLGISPARYYQLLDRLAELPAAREYDPLLAARLRRRRRARERRRVAGALGHRPDA